MAGVGIAGAQDYVARDDGDYIWRCVRCDTIFPTDVASAGAYIDKGLKQICKLCYTKEPKLS
jgi:uncharacterized C2H2 Zn-finger protein